MASHRQQKRKRCGDENSSTYTYRWGRLPSLSCTVVVMMVVVILDLSGSGVGVNAVPVITTVSMVVSKTLIFGPCTDLSGNVVGDQAEWTGNGCTRVVCHVEPSGNYTVTHKCRDLVPSENPDNTNCYTTVNQTAAYPSCCPYLQCGSAPLLTTVNPSLCMDGSSFNTCQIWKELSLNCTLTTSLAYNFTLAYCQATCGHCPGGVG